MELKRMEDTWSVGSKLDSRPSDITICVESCSFYLHKDVLSNNCDYFRAMFSSQMLENSQNTINIGLIGKNPFEVLVGGFYSGKLSLTSEDIFQVIVSAHILQVSSHLFHQCCEFLKRLIDPQKCFEIMHFTEFHNIQEVYNASRRYCLINFLTLCKEESFYTLNNDEVCSYLSDEFLVVDEDYEVLQALADWCNFNDISDTKVLQELVEKIVHPIKDSSNICEKIAMKLAKREQLDDSILCQLKRRRLHQDMMMFWARLSDSKGEGLVDVVKLESDEAQCVRVDTMTELVEKPGFDLGSAVCVKGRYVYACGGGPNFGRMDWIRDLWRYNVLDDENRWQTIGKLPMVWRYHTMVAVGTKLYMFGGFGQYRFKNISLNSFDIVEGEWQKLANVPTHETKPVATCHRCFIFYVCQELNVYAYNTLNNQWTILQEHINPFQNISISQTVHEPSSASTFVKPLFCFVSPNRSNSSSLNLIVFSEKSTFQTHSLTIDITYKSIFTSSIKQKHDLDVKTNAFLGMCPIDGRIVVVFKQVGTEEETDDEDWDKYHQDKMCTPVRLFHLSESYKLNKWIQMNNLCKSLCFVAVPKVPQTFCISNSNDKEVTTNS